MSMTKQEIHRLETGDRLLADIGAEFAHEILEVVAAEEGLVFWCRIKTKKGEIKTTVGEVAMHGFTRLAPDRESKIHRVNIMQFEIDELKEKLEGLQEKLSLISEIEDADALRQRIFLLSEEVGVFLKEA